MTKCDCFSTFFTPSDLPYKKCFIKYTLRTGDPIRFYYIFYVHWFILSAILSTSLSQVRSTMRVSGVSIILFNLAAQRSITVDCDTIVTTTSKMARILSVFPRRYCALHWSMLTIQIRMARDSFHSELTDRRPACQNSDQARLEYTGFSMNQK